MKQSNAVRVVMVVAVLAAGWVGCSRENASRSPVPASVDNARIEREQAEKARAEAERAEKRRLEFEAAMAQVDQLQQGGQTNEALALLEVAVNNRELGDYQAVFFQRMLFIELASEKPAEAQARFLAMRQANPEIARQCAGLIEGFLFEQKKFTELNDWLGLLLKDEKDEAVVLNLVRWQFRAARAQGTAQAAVTILTAMDGRINPTAWRGLAGEFGSILISEGAAEDAVALIEYMAGREAADPQIAPIRINLRLALWVSRQEWDPAVAFLKELAGSTADAPFNGYFMQLADPLRRAQAHDRVEALCKWALYDLKEKPAARESAAQLYIRNAVEQERVALALERIQELKKAGFDAAHLADWMDVSYSLSMQKGEKADFENLLALGQEIQPQLKDTRHQANVAGILLDVCFRLDRFADALTVLERGVAEKDKAWHALMINKVKAHLDVQEGRPLEAARKFIAFLNDSTAMMEPTIDPISGELITKEMVQGLNAKRIADLFKKGGNDAEAAVYYLKAKEYYTQALKTADPQSSWVAKIKGELAAMPQ